MDIKTLHRDKGCVIVNGKYEITPNGVVRPYYKLKSVGVSFIIPTWVDELAFIITGKR